MKECQAENKELRNKVKILEDFVTSHIAADVPTTFDTAVPDASSSFATVASASVSTSHVSLPSTNDVKNTNSEELLEKYKRLIGTLKEKRSKFIVSGILPRIGAENQFYNKAFSTNDRLKSLCSKENVEFLNLWNHLYDQRILFNHDGLHLNPVGSARLGRLLSDAVEAHRTKNG